MVTGNGAAGWHLLFALLSERRKILPNPRRLGMLGAEHLLLDRQRALE
jgi:hypothetical protein